LASNNGAGFTASRARSLLAAGFRALEDRKQEINDLNVYPVPDGDTGTNLALTLKGMVQAVDALPDDLARSEICGAISQAALMGARGNSGVILSQMVRGAMEALAGGGAVDAYLLAKAFRHATDTAYRAVRRPVEGTMLTVLREMAESAEAEGAVAEMTRFFDAVIKAGWASVEKTPTLLKVLADAGVVDAGGYGLVVLLEGASTGSADWEPPIATHIAVPAPGEGDYVDDDTLEEESRFTYCTSFLLSGFGLDQGALETQLAEVGDSLLMVGDQRQLKVHVHTDDPGRVLGMATMLGVLSEIEIDNMKLQTAARSRRLVAENAAAAAGGAGTSGTAQARPLTQVVAVVAGEGNKKLFRNLGISLLVEGGQSMNPSAEDLMRAVEKASATSVVILPNNSNVIMTAEQTAKLTEKEVLVAPSKSIQAGLSAAVVFDRGATGETNLREMRAALERVATAEITKAVRDSLVDGVKVQAGHYIGLVDEKVVASSADLDPVVDEVMERLLDGGREVVTVLLGDSASRAAADAIERLRASHPELEIEVHEGGQPFYPLLLAAE
jgi:uncharacterized protein